MKDQKFRNKIWGVILLVFTLTLTSYLIMPLAGERGERRSKVMQQLSVVWGEPQIMIGPVGLHNQKERPLESIKITGFLKTSLRKKGIYSVPFYESELTVSAQVTKPLSTVAFRTRSRVRIENAGIAEKKVIFRESFNGTSYLYEAVLGEKLQGNLNFKITFASLQSLYLFPIAHSAEIELNSNWKDPGFNGMFLPSSYNAHDDGFMANWKIQPPKASLHNAFGSSEAVMMADSKEDFAVAGIRFYQPNDLYQQTERSVKYAILFITLTFLAYFLLEVVGASEIHLMQYFLAGCAIVIFYLLLLALAEIMGFTLAYALASAAVVTLLGYYSSSFLGNAKKTMVFAGTVALLYALLYVILQLEEFALLAGTAALFVALVLTMVLTRKINWYDIGKST